MTAPGNEYQLRCADVCCLKRPATNEITDSWPFNRQRHTLRRQLAVFRYVIRPNEKCICLTLHTVILYYDHVLTLFEEIELFWRPAELLSLGSILFFTNRYLSVVAQVPVIYAVFFTQAKSRVRERISYVQYDHG